MLPIIPAIIRLLCIVVVVSLPESQQNDCETGWFGEKCRFQCHCLQSPTCDADGKCPDNDRCATGYFGPACQYVDLATKASADTVSYAIDGKEDTCNTNSTDRVVRVSWVSGITFTWLRLHVNKPGNLNSFKVKLNEKIDCPIERKFAVSETSVDVTCHVNFSVRAVAVIGEVAPDVCSIYISGVRLDHITGFVLTTYNVHGDLSFSYTERRSHTLDQFITQLPSIDPITMINITKPTKDLYAYNFLVICELQAFGEAVCSEGYYGLTCNKRCSCQGSEICFTVTGACSPGCPIGQYSANCALTCNLKCRHLECRHREGACLSCHEGYTGKYCAKACDSGTFGPKCALKCSKNCVGVCDRIDGFCHCRQPFSGPTCSECSPSFYGDNCTKMCPGNCAFSKCKLDTGHCISCPGARRGPYCEECSPGYYGTLCLKACSRFCDNGTCDVNTGACSPCTESYTGRNCNEAPVHMPWFYLITAVSVSSLLSLLFIGIYIRRATSRDNLDADSSLSQDSS